MFADINFYSLILIASGIISSVLAVFLYFRFRQTGKYGAYLLFLTSLWTLCSGIGLLQNNLGTLFTIVKIQYIAIAFFPSFYLLFILKFLNKNNPVKGWKTVLLFLEPVVILLLVWTNAWHHFYYRHIEMIFYKDLSLFKFTRGLGYIIHTIYFYSCLIAGLFLLQTKIERKKHVFSRQKKLIIFATLIPAFSNILYLFGIRPDHGIDLTPFAFTITALILAFGLYKFNLFDILPIAREQIIEELNEGVMVADEEERIVYVNPEMQRIIQRPEKIIIGTPVRSFFPALHHTQNRQEEIEIGDPAGQAKTYSVTISSFENKTSEKSGKTFLFTDITERKNIEKNLIEAKEIAEYAARSKSEFLSVMSHEIRTPMNAVIGFTNLLLQNARPDQQEYLKMLRFSGENLLVLINGILDYNKIEAGKIELEWIDFNLRELLHNIAAGLNETAKEKGIRLTVFFDEALPEYVKGDPVRLGQVFNNLAGNAVKFTEKGNIDLSAELVRKDENHISIRFKVKDTGIGIPAEKQKVIFDSFTQASSETTRKYGGTGLGLAISKKIIQLYNSNINLESEPGKGSCFDFTINFKISPKTTTASVNTRISNNYDLHGVRILLAEDNKINVMVAKQFLKQWSIECDVAENGKIALEMLQQNHYDLILMDLQMPVMDGFQTTKAIRNLFDDTKKHIPIIALTASGMLEVREKVLSAGMADTVTKPFDPEELFRKISRCLKTE